jgi:hypothetical protein
MEDESNSPAFFYGTPNPMLNASVPTETLFPNTGGPSIEELTRVFNTALVSTRVESARDFSAELYALVESPACRAILSAVRQLARSNGISEREAAETIIQTFRKLDRIWGEYLIQEGADRLRHAPGSN